MPDATTNLTKWLYSRLPKFSGSGSGVLTVSTTQAATGANSTETDLWTYTLPASTLATDGQLVRVTVFGSFGATANTKTVKMYFGSSSQSDASTSNAGLWRYTFLVFRTGAATQISQFEGAIGAAQRAPQNGAYSETLSSAIVIKFTGQNDGAAAANDIVFKGAFVELLN